MRNADCMEPNMNEASELSVPESAGRTELSPAVKNKKPQADFLLTITVIGLVMFGVVMVFSASYYTTISKIEDPYYYLIQGSKWAILGLALMLIFSFVPYKIYYKFAPLAMVFSLILLAALFVPGIGATENNATRWIEIGPITIMPSEISKVVVIFFVAWFFTKYKDKATTFRYTYLPMFVLILICFVLIWKQPNLSTAVIVCGIIAFLTCIAGNPKRYLMLTGGLGAAGVYALIQMNPGGEHLNRFNGFLDPFADAQGNSYQVVQGLMALGAGGIAGVGPGRSVQKALYLPYAQNDFIFTIVGEEFGFIGCLIVMCAFLFLIWRCALVAIGAPDRFSMLLASGVTIWLSLQVIMNIAVVTSLMPPTGVTLPFISYGGNAVLLIMIAMGIMLNISRASARKAAQEAGQDTETGNVGAVEVEVSSTGEIRADSNTQYPSLQGYGNPYFDFEANADYDANRGYDAYADYGAYGGAQPRNIPYETHASGMRGGYGAYDRDDYYKEGSVR